MGNAFSSEREHRCGICYFKLPDDSVPALHALVRRHYQWTDIDRVRHAERAEPLDTPLPYTLEDLKGKNAIVATTTTWPVFTSSVARGCAGCVALERLLLAAANDDRVVLDKSSLGGEDIVFEWSTGLARKNKWGNHNKDGLLRVRVTVDAGTRQLPLAYESIVPRGSELSRLSWTFKFDIDYTGPEELVGRYHPFAYWPPMTFGDTGSVTSMNKIRAWLDDCDEHHALCQRQPGKLPYRALELSGTASSATLAVRLVENMTKARVEYACLSHRWGPSTPNYRTLKDNISQHKQSIAWDSLPKTFQDAALATFRLGISYLWIDSLCIVQDDAEDWRVQAAQMCDIYQGAHLTLAASCSEDSTKGLFRRSTHAEISTRKNQYQSCALRRIPEHPTWNAEGVFQMSQELPILSRAWVFQERLLSRRLVHFTRYEIFFECSDQREGLCECQNAPGGTWNGTSGHGAGAGDDTNRRKNNHAIALRDADITSVKRYWHQIIQEYSGYDISFASDRLPALAGIARQYGTAHPELGRYVVGMWEKTLLQDLMWFCPQARQRLRPENAPFPSWSWVSVGHYVHLNTASVQTNPDDLIVVSFHVQLSGKDEYGGISEAALELEGYMVEGILVPVEKYGKVYPGFQANAGDDILSFAPDCPLLEGGPNRLNFKSRIFCLKTGFVAGGNHCCLILKETDDGIERIGMMYKASREWLSTTIPDSIARRRLRLV